MIRTPGLYMSNDPFFKAEHDLIILLVVLRSTEVCTISGTRQAFNKGNAL
jgi:hypothetical protein